MKKVLIALAALFLGLSSLNAQVFFPQLTPLKDMKGDLYPERQGEHWGYVNSKGKFIIKPVFDVAETFLRVAAPNGTVLDVAKVKSGGLWGYVSREGIYFIDPDYDYVSNFDLHSTALARKGSTYTLFGVEPAYSENLRTEVLKSVILEKGLGAEFSYTMKGYGVAMKDGRYGIIDTKGKWAVPYEYDLIAIDGSFYRIEREGLMGLVSLDGKVVFPCEYKAIKPFYDDVNLVEKSGGFGLATQKGNELLKAEYDSIDIRDESYLNLHRGMLSGLCDRRGRIVVPVNFNSIEELQNGDFLVHNAGGYNVYTASGEALFDQGYDSIKPGPRDGFLVTKDGLYGRTDEEGKFIYPCVFESEPDPDMNGYVELYVDDVPYIFLAGSSEAITVKEYDDDNYRKMSERRYRESDVLPNWLKGHLPRHGGAGGKWVLLKEGEVEVYSVDDLEHISLPSGMVYKTLLGYYFHEWAGRKDVAVRMNGEKEYYTIGATPVIMPLTDYEDSDFDGYNGVAYSTDLEIEEPGANGIAIYRILRTPHYWKRVRGVVKETGVGEDELVSCGFIGINCDFFVQPLFADAEAFEGDTARVLIDNEWRTLTAEEMKALDPFLLPDN